MPYVVLHNAVSVDGRVDWFPANVAKYYELAAVWKEDSTLVGTDTMIKAYQEAKILPEDPEAFQHSKNAKDDTRPLLVVPDSRGRLRHILHLLLHEPYWRDTVILTSQKTPQSYLNYLGKRHINFISAGEDFVDFTKALSELSSQYGIKIVRVDSGGTLNGILLRQGLVNEVSILIHPYLIGGFTPGSIYRASDLLAMQDALRLKLIHLEQLSEDLVWLRYEVLK
jgi:2,5-diamino-6-(ribosylamino)-4(3H)-pyrimidinone 5'-phosphate reductase